MLPELATLLVCNKLAPLLKITDPVPTTVKPFANESVCPALNVTATPLFTVQLQPETIPVELKGPLKTRFAAKSLGLAGEVGLDQVKPFQFLVLTVKTTLATLVQPEGLLVAVTVMVAVEGVLTKTPVVLVKGMYGVVPIGLVNSVLLTFDDHVTVEAVTETVNGITEFAQMFALGAEIIGSGVGFTVTKTLSVTELQPFKDAAT